MLSFESQVALVDTAIGNPSSLLCSSCAYHPAQGDDEGLQRVAFEPFPMIDWLTLTSCLLIQAIPIR